MTNGPPPDPLDTFGRAALGVAIGIGFIVCWDFIATNGWERILNWLLTGVWR